MKAQVGNKLPDIGAYLKDFNLLSHHHTLFQYVLNISSKLFYPFQCALNISSK